MSDTNFRSLDDLIDNWNTEQEPSKALSDNELSKLIEKHERDQKITRRLAPISHALLVIMCLSVSVSVTNTLAKVSLLLLLAPILYFARRDLRFKKKLETQDRATTVVEFTEQRRMILTEGVSYLKKGRVLIYPILVIGVLTGLYDFFTGDYTLKWQIVGAVYSIGIFGIIVRYLEKCIKEFEEKLRALN